MRVVNQYVHGDNELISLRYRVLPV